jgi:hypothetical protein
MHGEGAAGIRSVINLQELHWLSMWKIGVFCKRTDDI